jgi:hypothetical protein
MKTASTKACQLCAAERMIIGQEKLQHPLTYQDNQPQEQNRGNM